MGKITDKAIENLIEKKKQIEAQILAKQARLKSKERKKDTRKKIILGASLLAAFKANEVEKEEIKSLILKYALKDIELFDGLFSENEIAKLKNVKNKSDENLDELSIEALDELSKESLP